MANNSMKTLATMLGMIKTIDELTPESQADQLRDQLRKKAPAAKLLEQVGAIGRLQSQLGRVAELKRENPGIATNTGPYIGRLWNLERNTDAYGAAKPPGWTRSATTSLMNMLFPGAVKGRQKLQNAVDAAGQYSFDVGGKTLSAGESKRTDAPLPSMFQDDEQFDASLEETQQEWIPRQLADRINQLAGYYDMDTVLQLVGQQLGPDNPALKKIRR
jgi:hypothetical protein